MSSGNYTKFINALRGILSVLSHVVDATTSSFKGLLMNVFRKKCHEFKRQCMCSNRSKTVPDS
jgi:hypothetical protein